MGRAFRQALAGAAAWGAMSGAWASATTAVAVSDFRIELTALTPEAAPAVSFAAPVGSTSESNSGYGDPSADQHQAVASGRPFGAASTATSARWFASSAAAIAGDAFGAGAVIQTSAFAGSLAPQTSGDATVGLADGVSTASFALAPWTLMTISARVDAMASCTGTGAFDLADSGVLMAIGDAEGTGPQFAYVNIDAFALGAAGPAVDEETRFVNLSYLNDTAAMSFGVFSGYVASFALSGAPASAVPEPGVAPLLLAGLAILGLRGRPMKKAGRAGLDRVLGQPSEERCPSG